MMEHVEDIVSRKTIGFDNKTIYGHINKAREMENTYKIKNPKLLKADPIYSRYEFN